MPNAPRLSPSESKATPHTWWLALYPHLSQSAQRQLAALCLATTLLAQPIAGYARATQPSAPAPVDTRPAVQSALRKLGLEAPTPPDTLHVGSELQVNTYTTGAQTRPAVALDHDGDFVVVWQSDDSYGTDTIQAQRYNSLGTAQGTEFQVNTYVTGIQSDPAVTLDDDGDFVVVWESAGSYGTDSLGKSIQAQRYNSLGTAQGTEFQVNTYTTGDQGLPTVAADSAGNFVVTWFSNGSSDTDTISGSIQAQRYTSLGTAQGGQFQVNTYTTSGQANPVVALNGGGDFVIVWQSSGSSGTDTSSASVQAQRYNSLGTAQGGQFQVNTYTTNIQAAPSVALNSAGNFVVAWRSFGSAGGDTLNFSVQAQRYNSVGTAQGGQFQVNTFTTNFQVSPAVMLDDQGDFVITWDSYGSVGSDYSLGSIQAQRYNSLGTAQAIQFQVNTYTLFDQRYASAAINAEGAFVIVWQSGGSSDTDTIDNSIQAQRFSAPGTHWQVNTYITATQRYPSVAVDSDGDFVVVWQSYGSYGSDFGTNSIQGQRYNSLGTAQGGQFQINTYTTSQQLVPAIAMDSDGDFAVAWESKGSSDTDTLEYSIQAQRFNSVGTAQGTQFQVNTYTTDFQRAASIAMDSDGDFVIAWQSVGSFGTDATGGSVQAQRYNSVGTAQGAQFQVNTYTTSVQSSPAIAADSDGDFAITWQSFGSAGGDTLGYSIQAQRFNSAGTAQGAQFQVNSYTTSNQNLPALSMNSAGDFVIAWVSTGSGGTDTLSTSIQAQRYNSLGTTQGAQFQVNTYTTNAQTSVAVALDSDGDFLIVWHSDGSSGNDTSANSIQGRIFNKSGLPLLGEFQVNAYTASNQAFPAVALDSTGDAVIPWQSNGSSGNDNSAYSIQAARFDLGQLDLQINSYTTGKQANAAVALDSSGDFVVAWASDGSGGTDTLNYSIQAGLFDATGAPKGDQFQVNTYTTGGQRVPAVAIDSDGDFVIVWQSTGSADTDTSASSIQAQRYNSVGTAQGAQFQVNTYTISLQSLPSVALDSDGDMLIVWQSYGASGGDTLGYSVQARRYNSVGTAQGAQFQVNTYTTSLQRYPSSAMDSNGAFVVVWTSNGSTGNDSLSGSIQAQRFDATGVPQGTEFQVNTYTTNLQRYAAVALDASGDFVIVWVSTGSSASDTLGYSIQAQRYNAVGTAQGTQFQVNSYTTGNQRGPSVALDSDGDAVIVWDSFGSNGGDTLSYSIQAQRYNSAGTTQGAQFQVNTYTTNIQRAPAVALDSVGNFVVAWNSNGLTFPPFSPAATGKRGQPATAIDDSDYAIAASRFTALGGAQPTALSLGEANVRNASSSAWPAALVALGALITACWARLRQR